MTQELAPSSDRRSADGRCATHAIRASLIRGRSGYRGRVSERDETPKRRPSNRRTSPPKLRRGGKHCPVCLAPLRKIAPHTRLRRECIVCGAHVSRKPCRGCGGRAVWEGPTGAACQSCGIHGSKREGC